MQTATRTVTQQARKYDHVYDPLYVTSSQATYVRDVQMTAFSGLERVPDAGNMFSEMRRFPAASLRPKLKPELPRHIPLQFNRQGVNDPVPARMEPLVQGANRVKYFAKPNAVRQAALPPHVVLARPQAVEGAAAAAGGGVATAAGTVGARKSNDNGLVADIQVSRDGGKVTLGVQTQYRDSEAQTDPFTPDVIVRPGHDPEELRIADLTFGGPVGRRLPAGRAEVALVERLRERKELEDALPPMTDEVAFQVRKRMMRELEMQAIRQRQQEMEAHSERRLAQVEAKLEERERRREFISEQRVEAMRQQLQAEADKKAAASNKLRTKTLRKLGKARQAAEAHADALTGTSITAVTNAAIGGGKAAGKRSTRDVIGDYADHSSSVFAPKRREGKHPDRAGKAVDYEVEARAVRDVAGLTRLEMTLPLSMTTHVPSAPARRQPTNKAERKQEALSQDLDRVHMMLKTRKGAMAPETLAATAARDALGGTGGAAATSRAAAQVDPADVPTWRHPKKQVARPPTPDFTSEDMAPVEEYEASVLMLQRMLRGRAVQNAMLEGKERRLALLEEMRQDLLSNEEREQLERDEEQRRAQEQAELAALAAADVAQGEAMAATLDFLAKELTRQGEMGKMAARAAAADEERRRREAAEAGRRQAEQTDRAKRAAAEKQVLRVHQQAAEALVHEASTAAVARFASASAEAGASASVAVRAEQDQEVEAAASNPEEAVAAVVGDLVQGVLLPGVERARDEEKAGRDGHAAEAAVQSLLPALEGDE